MTPRHVILRQPHMAHLVDLPALAAMDDATLAALEAFMGFCAKHHVSDPGEGDFAAFAALEHRSAEDLDRLSDALQALGLSDAVLDPLRAARDAAVQKAAYAMRAPGPLARPRARKVSLRVDELPGEWQATLRRLRDAGSFAPSIQDRLEQRIGMFAWSAREAGEPIDLACAAARHALTNDLERRSIALSDDGTPRYAYLRTAWEEMLRFATAHGCGEATLSALRAGWADLTQRELRQNPLKKAKVQKAGTSSSLIKKGFGLLAAAAEKPTPNLRHGARNDAAAVGLGTVVPARPEDVVRHHVFGRGLFYEPAEDRYRFRYVPSKTRKRAPAEPLDLLLLKDFNPFFEALILQDHDRSYLDALRTAAIAQKRPLYVRPDGLQCAYGWYSRAWSRHAGTGGQIARTLINDEFAGGPADEDEIEELGFDPTGEFAIRVGMIANHHSSPKTAQKYRSDLSQRKSFRSAQDAMKRRAAALDMSDL